MKAREEKVMRLAVANGIHKAYETVEKNYEDPEPETVRRYLLEAITQEIYMWFE